MPPNNQGPPSALGNIVPLGNADSIPKGSPPSSYAAYAVVDGERGAVLRFTGLTVLRALLIAPGIAVAGVRGKQLVYGSLAGSALISVAAVGYALVSQRQTAAQPIGPLPTIAPPVPEDDQVVDTEGEAVPADQVQGA